MPTWWHNRTSSMERLLTQRRQHAEYGEDWSDVRLPREERQMGGDVGSSDSLLPAVSAYGSI